MKRWIGISLAIALMIGICVAGRVLPHLPNCTPLAAMALFAGFVFRSRGLALCVPLAALTVSDLVIGTYDWRIMLVVYLGLCLPVLMSRFLSGRWFIARLAGCTFMSSVLFFVASNLAVWAFSGFYSLSVSGLLQCLAAGLMFFKYTLVGDFGWTAGFFGVYALAGYLASLPRGSQIPAVAPAKA